MGKYAGIYLDEMMEEYRRAFDDQFPRMLTQGMSDETIAKLIDECLEAGRPYMAPDPVALY